MTATRWLLILLPLLLVACSGGTTSVTGPTDVAGVGPDRPSESTPSATLASDPSGCPPLADLRTPFAVPVPRALTREVPVWRTAPPSRTRLPDRPLGTLDRTLDGTCLSRGDH